LKYVHFIRGNYVARITVPEELRPILGLRELSNNLGPDKKSSEKRAHGAIAGFLEQIEEARLTLQSTRPTLSDAAKAHFRAELIADDRERAVSSNESIARGRAMFAPAYATLLRLTVDGQTDDEQAEALVGWAADDLIAKGIAEPAQYGSQMRRELLEALAEAQLDAMVLISIEK
jgi:hypothetical protein